MVRPASIRNFLAVLLVAAFPAAAAVTVSYPSQDYADIGAPGYDAEDVKEELARHLQLLGARYLSPQDQLRVDILDVDLAGERELASRAGREIRVLRGRADFPRITLRYDLQGARSLRGEETLADTAYLWNPPRYTARVAETLYYEKRMLEHWFRNRCGR